MHSRIAYSGIRSLLLHINILLFVNTVLDIEYKKLIVSKCDRAIGTLIGLSLSTPFPTYIEDCFRSTNVQGRIKKEIYGMLLKVTRNNLTRK